MAAEPSDCTPNRRGICSSQPSACRSLKPLWMPEMILPSPTETKMHKGRCEPGQLRVDRFPDFKGGGLLAFDREGVVAGVAAVPAEFLRGLDGQVEGAVVVAIHQDDLRAVDQQLGHLGGRSGARGEDHRSLPDRGRHARQGSPGVAGGGGDHHLGALISRARATTTALARSLKDAVGLRPSSLIHSWCRPSRRASWGGANSGVQPAARRGVPFPPGSATGSKGR